MDPSTKAPMRYAQIVPEVVWTFAMGSQPTTKSQDEEGS